MKSEDMENKEITALREALSASPDNVPLRHILAHKYFLSDHLREAEQEYKIILEQDANNIGAREGLAEIFFRDGKYSRVIVIAEELVEKKKASERLMVLYAKALLREKSQEAAQEIYEKIIDGNPDFIDDELDFFLRMPAYNENFEEEDDEDGFSPFDMEFGAGPQDSDFFMEKPNLTFKDVGGMDNIKEEIDIKIIKPISHASMFETFGKKTGGGILLYGPPGCGKTYIARATAGEINAHFISVGIQDILDMWIGRSEKNMGYIFDVARRNTPCVLFFDEMDALGASRSDMKNSSGRHVINQFLSELDGVSHSNDGLLILGATNAPWHLDNAFRRPGRFDRIIFVPPPDEKGKKEILRLYLKDKPQGDIDVDKVVAQTPQYSGADIKAIVDLAVESKLKLSIQK
jgi:SpoVK/Ycf46/Vps4 family AAA+-type ATPase